MEKKTVLFGSIIVLLVGGVFMMMWRARIMGPGARTSAGGLVAVSASGTPLPPLAGMQGTPPENIAIQQAGDLIVSFALDPYPPSVSKPASFTITLTDAVGRILPNASVSLDLTMPGMYMPPNTLTLSPQGGGGYQGSGHFTMRGLWRMEVLISLDGKNQSVFFNVWL